MGGKKGSKEDVNVSSAEEVEQTDDEENYVVERVVDKRTKKNRVGIHMNININSNILKNIHIYILVAFK